MRHFLLLIFSLAMLTAKGQVESDSVRYDEVRSIVNFYKYMLNTVGSDKTRTRDKEVIITESFRKVFSSPQVQIEDDLIIDRRTVTNKDVAAYLRDVDFFFKTVSFDFENVTIEKKEKEDSSFYFLASFESVLNGKTIDDESFSSSMKRYIEVNLDTQYQDLKIASVYSTKVSREVELQLWWESLSFGWKEIFSNYLSFDSISTETLLQITSIDSLRIFDNQLITNIEPLVALRQLEFLDISYTRVEDLNPLRHAHGLRTLKAAHTPLAQLGGLRYCKNLSNLDLSNSAVTDIGTISGLTELHYLNLSGTRVLDFSPIKELDGLQTIQLTNTEFDDPTLLASNNDLETVLLARTKVEHLFVFQSMPVIKYLDISESPVMNLNGLENHPALEELIINQTAVKELKQINGIPNLKKVYADLSQVSEETASIFMQNNPGTVVVTNSAQLNQWWLSLDDNWKTALKPILGTMEPDKEQLVKLINIDSLNLSEKKLYTTTPLQRFKRLRYLDISYNDFASFDFTKEMQDLQYLIAIDLPIGTTQGLESNLNLKQLVLRKSRLSDITSLSGLYKLETLDADETLLSKEQVIKHLETNPETVIIFQTDVLKSWWQGLNQAWKAVFDLNEESTKELHQLIESQEMSIENPNINSLVPLQAFIHLKSVQLDKIRVPYLNDLFVHKQLESLTYTNGPLQSLEGITVFTKLSRLNISNTAIEDLRDLYGLRTLKHLNCSGTGIKNFKGLDHLTQMETLDVSNTRIWRLERLHGMNKLKSFVCYNTRLSQAKIDSFQETFPNCQITFY